MNFHCKKSIFKNLVNELRKMGLVVKFEYKIFGNENEFKKFIPSKNFNFSSGKIIFINPPVGIECCGLETNEYWVYCEYVILFE